MSKDKDRRTAPETTPSSHPDLTSGSSHYSTDLSSSFPQQMSRLEQQAADVDKPTFRLRELMARMVALTRNDLPSILWVEATLFSIKPSGSGLALELVDKDADDASKSACLRVFAFSSVVTAIEGQLGLPLTSLSGSDVRLLIKPRFHHRYQLGGEVRAIDPAVAEGLLAQRLEVLRQTLRQTGLYDRQKKLRAPADITDLIIIHPAHSAGWADIAQQLQSLEAKGLLRLHNLTAAFEGDRAASELSHALAVAQGLVWDGKGDLVLIVRGGGAASGLAALMDGQLAEQVCLMSVPVVTGTGHAIDRSILDEVAWKTAHTPSLALGMVLDILKKRSGDALADWELIRSNTRDRYENNHLRLFEELYALCRERAAHVLNSTLVSLDGLAAEIIGRRSALPRECELRHGHIDALMGDIDQSCDRLIRHSQASLENLLPICATAVAACIYREAERLGELRQHLHDRARLLAATQFDALEQTSKLLVEVTRLCLAKAEESLQRLRSAAGSLSLDGTLLRGFCLAHDDKGSLLRTALDAKTAGRFSLLFIDGTCSVRLGSSEDR